MTQIQLTDQQLNRALAVLMGYTEDKRYPGRVIKGTAVTMPRDYCTDPAASLEVQTAAYKQNRFAYCDNLYKLRTGQKFKPYAGTFHHDAGILLSASPRERAEAAYITLREGVK